MTVRYGRSDFESLPSTGWLLIGALVAIAVFSTTYRIGGVLVYPRLLIALVGLWLVARRGLVRFACPAFALLPIGAIGLIMATINFEWAHAWLFTSLMVRGIIIPYLTALALASLLGLLGRRRSLSAAPTAVFAVVSIAIGVQGLVSIAMVVDSGLREAVLSVINLSDVWRQEAESGHFRYSGIGGISIYDTSMAYAILASLFLLSPRDSNGRTAISWMAAATLTITIVLCLLHGRTGLLCVLVLVGLLVLRDLVGGSHSRIGFSLRFAAVCVALFSSLYMTLDPSLRETILEFAGELFVNAASGDGLHSESTDDFLENHLKLPDAATLLTGSGVWAQPDLVESSGYWTDSGVLLLLNYGGVLLVFTLLASLTLTLRLMTRRIAPNPHRVPGSRLFTLYLITVFALVSLKGPIFMSEHCMTALFLVVFIQAALSRTATVAPRTGVLQRQRVGARDALAHQVGSVAAPSLRHP